MKPIENSAAFLEETGLLFEINVKVLHKYGLSLDVEAAANLPAAHTEREDRMRLVVKDQRDADGGVLCKPLEWSDGAKRLLEFVRDEGAAKMKERLDLIGCLVQDTPVPGKLAGPFNVRK
jgi:hypothetical protein